MRTQPLRAALCVFVLTAGSLWADTYTWDAGGGADTNWSTGLNWTNVTYNNAMPLVTDDAAFSGTVNRTVFIGSGDQGISNVLVSGSAAWTWSGTNTLNLGGTFTYNSTASSTFGAKLGGSGALVVTNGSLYLTNANTYSGGTILRAGILAIGNSDCLGTNTLTLKGGQLATQPNDRYYTNGCPVVVDGDIQFGPTGNNWNKLVLTNTVTLTGNRSFLPGYGSASELWFVGPITDNGQGYYLRNAGGSTFLFVGTNNSFSKLVADGGFIKFMASETLRNTAFDLGTATVYESVPGWVTNTFSQIRITGNPTIGYVQDNQGFMLNGPVLLTGDRTITAPGNNAANYPVFSGVIDDGASTWSLTKAGNSRLGLINANTFKGALSVIAGLLRLENSNANISGCYVSGGALEVGYDNCVGAGTLNLGNPFNYSGVGAVNAAHSLNNAMTFSGNVYLGGDASGGAIDGTARILTLSGPATITPALPLYLNAPTARETWLSGPASSVYASRLVKAGAGTLVLSGDNTLPGGFQVDAGTLKLLGDNSAVTGGLIVNGGTLWGKARAAGTAWGTNTLTLNPGATAWHEGLAATDTGTGIGLLSFAGSATLCVTNPTAGNITTFTADNLLRSNRGALVIRGLTGTSSANLGVTERFKLTTPPQVLNGMVAPYLVKPAANTYADFLNYLPACGFTQVTYSTSTDMNTAGATAIFSSTVGQTLTADREVYALQLQQSGGITTHNGYTVTLGSGGLIKWIGSSSQSYSGNFKFGTQGDKEAALYVGDGAGTYTLSGTLTTTNGLTKFGPSLLILSGSNLTSLAGPITLHAGGLRADGPYALPNGQPLILNGSTFNLNSNNLIVNGLTLAGGAMANSPQSTVTITGEVTYVASGAASTIGTMTNNIDAVTRFLVADGVAGDDLTVNATLAGANGLVKAGAGVLSLTASNSATLAGTVRVQQGTLKGSGASSLSSPFSDTNAWFDLSGNGKLYWQGKGGTGGLLTFAGGNELQVEAGQGSLAVSFTNILRKAGSRGTLLGEGAYVPQSANANWSVNPRVYATAMTTTNMMPAYFLYLDHPSLYALDVGTHLQYNGQFLAATYPAAIDINGATSATFYNAGSNSTLTGNAAVYCLRTTYDILQTGGPWTLTVGRDAVNQASVIVNGTNTIAPNLKFGPAGNFEACVFVARTRTATFNGTLTTTGGLTKFGPGTLRLHADNSASYSGGTYVQMGTLAFSNANAIGTSDVLVQKGAALEFLQSFSLPNSLAGGGQILTGPNTATLTGAVAPGEGNECATLTAEDLDFRGTYNWQYDGTNCDTIACTTLAFGGGSATLNASYIGSGLPRAGVYTLFTYKGSAPTLPSWTLTLPRSRNGVVSLDATNQRVLLTLTPTLPGSAILFR
jgi:autotransporter-associated beta strand protein